MKTENQESLNPAELGNKFKTDVSVSALIAQYLGFKEDERYPTLWIIKDQINQNGNNHFWEGNLKYNESWDWLMPVIEKITKEVFPEGDILHIRTFGLVNPDTGNYMFRFHRYSLFEAPNLIDAAFEAVGEFLRNRE
jgi:hypothetical protein